MGALNGASPRKEGVVRVLVSGAAGFIGSHVIQPLVDAGHEVIGLDTHDAVARGMVPRPDSDARLVVVDPDDDLTGVVDGIDAVCHQAFRVGTGDGFDDLPWHSLHNDLPTARLLAALHRTGFTGRLVLGSSVSVYGDGAYDCTEHGRVAPGPRRPRLLEQRRFEAVCPLCGRDLAPGRITEDTAVAPRGISAVSRVHQEMMWQAYATEHEAPLTILRAHHVYGPNMPRDTPQAGVAGVFRSHIDAGIRPQVYEDGGQRRDFVHVSDVARATVLATTTAYPHDGPLNIGSGRSTTLLEVATTLCVARDSRLWPEVTGRSRPADARHLLASTKSAEEILGFRARIGLQEGMAGFATAPLRDPEGVVLIGA